MPVLSADRGLAALGGLGGNKKRVERLWLNDGSCVRLRPMRRNQVWAYDFVEDRTPDGRKYRILGLVDEFTCGGLVISVCGCRTQS